MANYWHTSCTSIIWIQHHCIHKVQKPLDSLGLNSFKVRLKSKHPKTWNLFWKSFIAQFKSQHLWQLWEHMAQVVWASVKAPLILLRCCPPDDIFSLACFIRRCQMTFQQRKKRVQICPDLPLTEHIWHIMKRKKQQRRWETVELLKLYIK